MNPSFFFSNLSAQDLLEGPETDLRVSLTDNGPSRSILERSSSTSLILCRIANVSIERYFPVTWKLVKETSFISEQTACLHGTRKTNLPSIFQDTPCLQIALPVLAVHCPLAQSGCPQDDSGIPMVLPKIADISERLLSPSPHGSIPRRQTSPVYTYPRPHIS